MGRYGKRARGHEYMDEADIGGQRLFQALRELEAINRYLGGHRTSILGLGQLLRSVPASRELAVLDIGAGGGDAAAVIERWGHDTGRSLRVTSMDINPATCAMAKVRGGTARPALVVAGDVFRTPFHARSFDIVHSSLFLHHFGDDDAVKILRTMRSLSRLGVVVNDLHRHPLAYWSVRLGSALLSRSEFVRHDGPLSVLRGFRRHELESVSLAAGAEAVSLCWRWGFRWGLCLPSRQASGE
jgi:SAM-dependent methyltransferase